MPSPRSTEQIMTLFEQCYEELYCYLRRFTIPSESEDFCQQVFLELADHSDEGPVAKETLFHAARRLLKIRYQPLLRIQKALHAVQNGSRWNHARLQNNNEHPEPMTARRLRLIERALKKLPSDQRQSIRLVIADDLGIEEASNRMGVTSSLVEAWASSGLHRLNKRMDLQSC